MAQRIEWFTAPGWPSGREIDLAAWPLEPVKLAPHRDVLRAIAPMLVMDPERGVLGASTGFSRERVEGVFHDAVRYADDAPDSGAGALGRMLYLAHLAVLLFSLLDRSDDARATERLLALFAELAPFAAIALRFDLARSFVTRLDAIVRDALLATPDAEPTRVRAADPSAITAEASRRTPRSRPTRSRAGRRRRGRGRRRGTRGT